MKKRLVVLVSGSGSNLQSILDHCKTGSIDAQVVAVISNRPGVRSLLRAEAYGCAAITIDHTAFENRHEFDKQLQHIIDQYQPDFVVLAGFMRILTEGFVRHFLGKMVNIHPSLLPKYPGLNTHQRAIDAGEHYAGATVHFVTPELDGGPSIAQSPVPITPGVTAKELAKQVLGVEHTLYPTVLQWLCSDRLTLAEDLPQLDGAPLLKPIVISDTASQ